MFIYSNNREISVLLLILVFGLFVLSDVDHAVAQSQVTPTIPERWDYNFTVHERVKQMENIPTGPLVRLGKEQILSASFRDHTNHVLISEDNGQTWYSYPVFKDSEKYKFSSTRVQRTDDGIVIIAFSNSAERHWTWDDDLGDAPGARLPTFMWSGVSITGEHGKNRFCFIKSIAELKGKQTSLPRSVNFG